jgi:hypothetical protein
MTTALEKPTVEAVKIAVREFDEENQTIETALTELFSQYPHNTEESHVLLKVVALNELYSTQIRLYSERIPTILDVVRHIVGIKIDADLGMCLPDLVDTIADTTVEGKDHRCYYSFATKYCSWHRPESYPIWDSRVDKYLWRLRNQDRGKQGGLRQFEQKELWSYPHFKKVVDDFRIQYRLNEFSYKQIDKFLWSEGIKLFPEQPDGPQPEITVE